MVCAANVVSGDDGNEGSGTVGASGLHTTECVSLDSGGRAVAVTLRLHTGVDTCGVTSPHLDVGISDGLAGRSVNDIDVQVSNGTLLAGQQILTNEFTGNP